MVRAVWNGEIIAESNRTEVVEGNHYFPIEDVKREFLTSSDHHTTCAWKGTAQYYNVVVDGQQNQDAAWYYADPKPAAKAVSGKVAFWKGVRIEN